MNAWLLLVYSVPRQPSARRVHVWRKLKQLGAETLQDAVWALPKNARTLEQFQWLAAEIREMGGEATIWRGQLAAPQEHEAMVKRFEAPVIAEYRRMLADLSSGKASRAAIARRYWLIQARDFFACPLGQQVRAALLQEPIGGES